MEGKIIWRSGGRRERGRDSGIWGESKEEPRCAEGIRGRAEGQVQQGGADALAEEGDGTEEVRAEIFGGEDFSMLYLCTYYWGRGSQMPNWCISTGA